MAAPPQSGPSAARHGFTLIELIVVLAIIAALTALAATFLGPVYARVRAAYERDDIERQLRELPQRVRLSGRGGILTSRSGDNLPEGAAIAVEGVPDARSTTEAWQVLRLSLSDSWRVQVDRPIFYHFSGSCEGGKVTFLRAPISLNYVLAPPLCRPIRANALAGF